MSSNSGQSRGGEMKFPEKLRHINEVPPMDSTLRACGYFNGYNNAIQDCKKLNGMGHAHLNSETELTGEGGSPREIEKNPAQIKLNPESGLIELDEEKITKILYKAYGCDEVAEETAEVIVNQFGSKRLPTVEEIERTIINALNKHKNIYGENVYVLERANNDVVIDGTVNMTKLAESIKKALEDNP